MSSWILAGFAAAEPQWNSQNLCFDIAIFIDSFTVYHLCDIRNSSLYKDPKYILLKIFILFLISKFCFFHTLASNLLEHIIYMVKGIITSFIFFL